MAVRVAAGPHPVDDAYITFRYARNLAAGLGMVYNPGEQVLGTSTLLYTIYLAALVRLFGPGGLPIYALLTSALADGLAVVLLGQIARRLHAPPGWIALSLLLQALAPLGIRYAVGGLETSLVTAVLLGVTLAHLARRNSLAASLAGAAVLLRPDALASGGGLVLSQIAERRRFPWRTLAILALWIAPAMVLLGALYSSPIPHSIATKSVRVYQASEWINGLQFLYHFAGLFLGAPLGLAARGIVIVPSRALTLFLTAVALPQLLLWVLGARLLYTEDRRALAFLAVPAIYAGAYTLVGLRGAVMAEWYLPPLIPFYLLPMMTGLRGALTRFTPHAMRPAAATLGLLLVACEVLGLNLGRDPSRAFFTPISVWDEREGLYREAAQFLEPRLDSGSLVAASEIGALGYYCDCRILDTVGLVSPHALGYYPLPPEDTPALNAIPTGLVREHRPEFVVSLEVFMRETLLDDPWFQDGYELIWRAETSAFGSDGLLIYQIRR